MWSEVNNDYVKQLVLTQRANGYPYYIAHTVTNVNGYSNNNAVSFKVYFSDKPIKGTGLCSFEFSGGGVVCYSVVSANANSNYYAQRVTTSGYSGTTLNVNNYEFIYTNAAFEGSSVQPDIALTPSISKADFQGVSIVLIVVLLSTVTYKLIRG